MTTHAIESAVAAPNYEETLISGIETLPVPGPQQSCPNGYGRVSGDVTVVIMRSDSITGGFGLHIE